MTVQKRILDLLRTLQRETGIAIIFITHDLGVVAELCDRTLVMYAGQGVECGPTAALLDRPRHPYTAGLLRAARLGRHGGRLETIPGAAPRFDTHGRGCRFFDRCSFRLPGTCDVTAPDEQVFEGGRMSRCLRATALDLTEAKTP